MPERRGQKKERDQLARSLRADGRSWVDIAEVLRRRYRVNARVALRHAHGWSQREVADEWNRRWPDELKTFKTFSYWEQWPSSTGHVPSFANLTKLAELYQCAVSDVLADLPSYRHRDPAASSPTTVPASPTPEAQQPGSPNESGLWTTVRNTQLPDTLAALLTTYLGVLAPTSRDALTTPRELDHVYHRLVRFLHRTPYTVDRRVMLRMLGSAAAAASLFPALDADEQQRVAAVLSAPSRVDARTIEHIEAALSGCRRQDDALGPQAVLDTVLAQRALARVLLPDCPAALRARLLSTVSQASCQAGWLSFDLNQFDHAAYYYEDARTLAHEAQNIELGVWVLGNMSYLATWRGSPRTGIDHAVAAGRWVHGSGDMLLRSFASNVAARAYAAQGQRGECLAALDTSYEAYAKASLKKYRPMAARNEDKKVFSGLL